jgi:hypothetical protein
MSALVELINQHSQQRASSVSSDHDHEPLGVRLYSIQITMHQHRAPKKPRRGGSLNLIDPSPYPSFTNSSWQHGAGANY